MARSTGAGLGIALAAVCALSLIASPVSGARVVAETKLTISRFLPLYHGKVKSDFAECKRDRKVILYRKRSGPDQKIGSDRSNSKGKWKVSAPGDLAPGDRFYAKARNFEASGTGTGLSCMKDRSRTVEFVGG